MDPHAPHHPVNTEQLLARVEVLERRADAARRKALLSFGGVGMAAALLWAPAAYSAPSSPKTCAHSDLYCFGSGEKASADEVNSNFETVYDALDQKLPLSGGTLSGSLTAGATTVASLSAGSGTISTTGAMSASTIDATGVKAERLQLSHGVIQRGGDELLTTTSDLGLYSQTKGSWIRIVTNDAPVRFFSDSGIGSSLKFSVEKDGRLASSYGEDGTYSVLPSSFCVVVPKDADCPNGWDEREVKWDTEDNNNKDSGKDGKIAWDNGNSGSVRMRFCCRGSGF